MESKKYAIVTGGSRGLGAAIAEELAREGYDLIITYRTQSAKGEAVKKKLMDEFGVRVEDYRIAIQEEEEVKAFRQWAEEHMGKNLQVLVNNAGVYVNTPADEMEPAVFKNCVDVNVNGTFYMCRYFVDLMKEQHYGKIINLCSAVGLRAAPGSVAYASSKFAIRGMTQALALDWGKYNIQVNAIAPGAHKTDMYYDAYKIDPELMDTRTKSCPLQRAGEVSEMHHIVRYFLASDFITGQVVSMNGGTTMV
jgi:NAD(P)-dependent dehydrogenase (short-subunit alcohol dehydrogenase family)